jgi:hypothetical protein
MKAANIMLKGETAYLNSISSTNFLKMDTPPFLIVNWKEQSFDQKLSLIEEAINGSKKGLQFPESPAEYSKYILQSFGFKSYSQMYKQAINCDIKMDEENEVFLFNPLKTVKNGTEGLEEGSEKVSIHANAQDIIATLERVLARCE